jgi:hypothetical protein
MRDMLLMYNPDDSGLKGIAGISGFHAVLRMRWHRDDGSDTVTDFLADETGQDVHLSPHALFTGNYTT